MEQSGSEAGNLAPGNLAGRLGSQSSHTHQRSVRLRGLFPYSGMFTIQRFCQIRILQRLRSVSNSFKDPSCHFTSSLMLPLALLSCPLVAPNLIFTDSSPVGLVEQLLKLDQLLGLPWSGHTHPPEMGFLYLVQILGGEFQQHQRYRQLAYILYPHFLPTPLQAYPVLWKCPLLTHSSACGRYGRCGRQ